MEMNQKDWEEMAKYMAGEMNNDELLEYSEMLKSNNEKSDLANQIKTDWIKMDEYKNTNQFDSNKAWEKLFGKLQTEGLIENKNKQRTVKIYHLYLKIAAVFLIGVMITTFYYYLKQNPSHPSWKVADTYGSSEIREIILADGSIILLNTSSKLYYPEEFTGNERIVEFEGDAFFEIKKNHAMPFRIKVKNAEIKVLGTSFNVNTNIENDNIEVLVSTGRVNFSEIKNDRASVLLEEGYIGKLSNDKITRQLNTNKNYLSWKTKYFDFTEGIKLSEAIKILNRAYHVKIVCNDRKVCDKILNTTFDNESLEKILNVVCTTYNLKIEKKDNEIHIFN